MDPERLNLYFREIVFHNPGGKKDSVCGVFSYEALNTEDAVLGNLYLVGKISNIPPKKYRNTDFMLNLLASAIKREFYSNLQRTPLEAMESALQGANIYLADFVKKGHDEWIGNLHFTCLVFSRDEIYIGQIGDMISQLFRGDTVSNIGKKFLNPDLEPEPNKTFSNIASGKIKKGDKIVIATQNILDIANQQRIKELLSHASTDRLYHYLKDTTKQIKQSKDKSFGSLACLILDAAIEPPKEDETIVEEKEETEQNMDLEQLFQKKTIKITKKIKSRLTFPSKFTLFIVDHPIAKFLVFTFLIILIVTLPYLSQKLIYDKKIGKVDDLVRRATENVERSSVSLAYQNQSDARTFLNQAGNFLGQAQAILQELPKEAQYLSKAKLSIVQEQFDKQRDTLNNIINITQAEKIADLANNTYTFNPKGVLKLENSLYLYELTSGFLYKLDLSNNSPTLIFLSSKETFKLGAVDQNSILLLNNPEKVSVYDINEKYNVYLLNPNLENTLNIKDMTDYGNALFFLDVNKLNVWKYARTEGVLNGAFWLKSSADELANAQSIAVDGDVFVSLENGTIIQYSQGKKVKQINFEIEPKFTKGGKIFTNDTMKDLYILDQQNNRIISYNKKDGIIKQYISTDFNNLKDFWVEPDEKTIYILNGLEILRVEI